MKKCPKCDGDMEIGWTGPIQQTTPIRWFKGEMKKSWGRYPKPALASDIKEVVAYRCTHCDFLEYYAQPRV